MKRVNKGARIVLGGQDISDYVTRWSVGAATGDLYKAEIDVIDHPDVIEIVPVPSSYDGIAETPVLAQSGARVTCRGRVSQADKILIRGTDVGSWVEGYDRKTRAGGADVIRLYVHCDEDSLLINDTTPWVDRL